LTLAAAAVLAVPSTALGAYVPRFLVSHDVRAGGTQAETTLRVTFARTDDATARIQILVPPNYDLDVGVAAGTIIGNASAQVLATAISPDTIAPLEGPIRVADRTQHQTSACAPGLHSAVWIAELAFSGQTIPVPFYVDEVPAAQQATIGASHTIVTCFASPSIPPAAGGAPLGAKILDARLTLVRTLTRTPTGTAQNVWRGIFTPYLPNSGTPNAAGTVEARSFVGLPKTLTLRVVVRKRVVTLSGQLSEGGVGVPNVRVLILRGARGRALQVFVRNRSTNASGRFTHTIRYRSGGSYRFQVRAVVPERDLGAAGCGGTSAAPAGCVSATAAGYTVQSAPTRFFRIR
jgi:hypothetical protein